MKNFNKQKETEFLTKRKHSKSKQGILKPQIKEAKQAKTPTIKSWVNCLFSGQTINQYRACNRDRSFPIE